MILRVSDMDRCSMLEDARKIVFQAHHITSPSLLVELIKIATRQDIVNGKHPFCSDDGWLLKKALFVIIT